jgi:hypothetical protein
MKKIFVLLFACCPIFVGASEESEIDPRQIIEIVTVTKINESSTKKITVPCIGSYFTPLLPKAAPGKQDLFKYAYNTNSHTLTVSQKTATSNGYYFSYSRILDITANNAQLENAPQEIEYDSSDLFKLTTALQILHAPGSQHNSCIIVTDQPIEQFKKFLDRYTNHTKKYSTFYNNILKIFSDKEGNNYSQHLEECYDKIKEVQQDVNIFLAALETVIKLRKEAFENNSEIQSCNFDFANIELMCYKKSDLQEATNIESIFLTTGVLAATAEKKKIILIQAKPCNKKNKTEPIQQPKPQATIQQPAIKKTSFINQNKVRFLSAAIISTLLAYLCTSGHMNNFLTTISQKLGQ